MVIRIELRIFDQIVTSVSFWPRNGNSPRNAETLKRIVCQTAPLAKLPSHYFLTGFALQFPFYVQAYFRLSGVPVKVNKVKTLWNTFKGMQYIESF